MRSKCKHKGLSALRANFLTIGDGAMIVAAGGILKKRASERVELGSGAEELLRDLPTEAPFKKGFAQFQIGVGCLLASLKTKRDKAGEVLHGRMRRHQPQLVNSGNVCGAGQIGPRRDERVTVRS
jgi:hypothetical protein